MTDKDTVLPKQNPFRTMREQKIAERITQAATAGLPKVMPTISANTPEEIKAARMKLGNGVTIDDLLKKVVNDGASDLHLSCDGPPRYRVDGDLLPINGMPDIADEWLKLQMQTIVPPVIWENFLEDGEADLSYALEGYGRFRVNIFKQRGTTAAVLRTIPTKIKTIAELGVPETLHDLVKKKKGLILVTGPTGSGKALRLDTKIPTPTGSTTMGELNVGDMVIDSQGNPTRVTGMSPINKTPDLFKLTLSDGQELFADADHQWIVATHTTRNKARHWKTIQTENNSKKGLEAAAKLFLLSDSFTTEEMRLSELQALTEQIGVNEVFPSEYSIRATLGFMDVNGSGGNGSVPLKFNASETFFALGTRLLQRYERKEESVLKTMSTAEIIAEGLTDKWDRTKFSIPLSKAVNGVKSNLPIDPYVLGVWLGDGNSGDGRITVGSENVKEMKKLLSEAWDGEIIEYARASNNVVFSMKADENNALSEPLFRKLRMNNLKNNKHIPIEYLRASYEQRLSLLQGLMDTDGTVNQGGTGFTLALSEKKLAYGCLDLIRSLGIKATINSRKSGYKDNNGIYVECKDSYNIRFSTILPVAKLKKKSDRILSKAGEGQKWLYIKSIEKIEQDDPEYGPARCISVDSPDKSYLCGDYVVTHNTTTLTAMIDAINDSRREHIVTIEDPIEFVHTNKKSLVNQREIGTDTLSFSEALKRVLRQDPDVILIGELRDAETISTALTAAETGHLVFGTLHTQSATKTIDRIIDTFPPVQQQQVRSQLADTIQAVIAQALVKKIGGGRVAATEIMVRTSAIANQIREGQIPQIYSSIQTGKSNGMHTLDDDLKKLVKEGLVEKDEVAPLMVDPSSLDGLMAKSNDWSY